MSLYSIKKIDNKRKIVWNSGRLRGIKEGKERIGDISYYVKELLRKKEKINILEIGCGYGKALIELKKEFKGKVKTHGINLERRWNLNIIRKFAVSNKLVDKNDINYFLPKIFILDAGKKIPLIKESFDFIFSQASVQYITNKSLFLEEVNRLLTKEGIALIEIQEYKREYPKEYKNLFEINIKNKIIKFRDYIKKFNNIIIKTSKFRPWTYIIMKKSKKLKLNLKLVKSIDLNKINKDWWGVKSIFILKK